MASLYNTRWVNSIAELPVIGVECPVCDEGIIEDNSFTSKKGISYKSVSCPNCRVDWVVSQWKPKKTDFKTTPEIKKMEDETEKILERLERIIDNMDSGLVGLRMDINDFIQRLDKLAEYLKGKLG